MPPDVIYNQWVADGQKNTGKAYKAVVYTGKRLPDQWTPSDFTFNPGNDNFTKNDTGSFNGTGSGAHTSVPLHHDDQALFNKTFPLSVLTAGWEDNSTSDSGTQSYDKALGKRTYGNMLSDSEVVRIARGRNILHHVEMGDSKVETWRRQNPFDGHSYPLNSAFLSTTGLCGCTAIVLWSPNAVLLAHQPEAAPDPGQSGPWWIDYSPTQALQRHLDGVFVQEAQSLIDRWTFLRNPDGSFMKTPGIYEKDDRGRVRIDSHGRPLIVPGSRKPIWDERRFPRQRTQAIIIAPHKDPNYRFHTDPDLTQEPPGQPMPNDWFHPPQVAGLQRMFRDWNIAYETLKYAPRQAGPGRNQMFQEDSRDIVMLNIEESSRDRRNLEIRLYYDGHRAGNKMPLGRDRSPSPPQQGSSSGGRGHGRGH